MILFSVGLPNRFAEWCDAVTARLAQHSFGAIEDVAVATIRTSAPYVIAVSRQPVVRLQSEIVQSNRPFLLALGDPRASVRHLVEQAGYGIAEATRAVSSSCAAMLTLTTAPRALVLSSAEAAAPLATATAIAEHLGVPVSAEAIADIVGELGALGTAPDQEEGSAWLAGLEARDQAIIGGALQSYVSYFSSRSNLDPLVWERELFFIYEDPPTGNLIPATRPVDITGRARVLLYGPGVNLPPGAWSANVVLGYSPEVIGRSFTVDVFAGRQLTATRVEPLTGQVIEANLHFTVDSTLDQRIEIRVLSDRAAFDGRLALGHATLTRQSGISDDTQEDLLHMLQA